MPCCHAASQSLVARLLRNGTTTALYFASLHLAPTLTLARVCARAGQRAFVGKVSPNECWVSQRFDKADSMHASPHHRSWFVCPAKMMGNPADSRTAHRAQQYRAGCWLASHVGALHGLTAAHPNFMQVCMDRNSPDSYVERAADGVRDTEVLIQELSGNRLVRPVITPRFVPSCTPEIDDRCKSLGTVMLRVVLRSRAVRQSHTGCRLCRLTFESSQTCSRHFSATLAHDR